MFGGFSHHSWESRSFRWWWHSRAPKNSTITVEFSWRFRFALFTLTTGDGWGLSMALPPLFFHIGLQGFGLWHPRRMCMATWDNNREFWVNDEREFTLRFSDWTFNFIPWGRSNEWRKSDPWWIRGLSLNLLDLLLGRAQYSSEVVGGPFPIHFNLPEGTYQGIAKFERCVWRRPRWFARSRQFTEVSIPKGLPYAGKGENSWDCGDDGLFGYSNEGYDISKAAARGVQIVMERRARYGQPSQDAIQEALS